jgi:hypothetical protein
MLGALNIFFDYFLFKEIQMSFQPVSQNFKNIMETLAQIKEHVIIIYFK